MRVLWVTAEPPDRRGGGGNIRQSLLLERVARAGHEVDLLVAGGPPDDVAAASAVRLTRVPVTAVHRPTGTLSRRALALRLAVHGGPAELHDNGPARKALRAAWPTEEHDVVLVEHAGLSPLVRLRRPGEHWACTLHNVASGTAAGLRDVATGARQRLLLAREASQAAALERFVVSRYDSVVSVSSDDAALLPGPSVVVPNGVDLAVFSPTPLPGRPRLVFTGTLSYLPNVDGLQWFCADVLPHVVEAEPDVVLDIVGRDPVPEVAELAKLPHVEVHADVPSVVPYLGRAQICLVPLRVGTGSRLKALEAMAAGRPVVGTSVGLAGLGLEGQAAVADGPAELAHAVVTLLRDPVRAHALAAAGREHVERTFGWDSVAQLLVSHLEEVARQRGRS